MTTPSGTISMSQINTEVGYPSTQSLDFNNSRFRALAGVFSGQISISSARGKTYTTKQVFSATGASTFVVPANITTLYVKLWGSGGGGGGTGAGSGYTAGGGGSAGHVYAAITVTPGETLNVFVPYGGQGISTAMYAAGGGSWAGIFRSTTPLLIAGGGGGGGAGRNTTGGDGGAGGGLTAGTSNYRGGSGGSQTGGGGGGSGDTNGLSGSIYKGGDGGNSGGVRHGDNGAGAILGVSTYGQGGDSSVYMSDHAGGGGGGAGYYGGGGGGIGGNSGNQGGGGGGGGSSYVGGANTSIMTPVNTPGVIGNNNTYVSPGGSGDADYITYGSPLSVGVGGAADAAVLGGQGLVVISWSY